MKEYFNSTYAINQKVLLMVEHEDIHQIDVTIVEGYENLRRALLDAVQGMDLAAGKRAELIAEFEDKTMWKPNQIGAPAAYFGVTNAGLISAIIIPAGL